MDKAELKISIKNVKEGIAASIKNRDRAQHHIEEGEIILKALEDKLQNI